ncbi:MAG: insulinase family protein [Bacteroidales bacterium]|nr:insulinase family protein [Bacteroidales bacterium]
MTKSLFSFLAFVLFAGNMFAQTTVNMESNAAIPMDPSVRHGVLENGLTYYIKVNEKPENRAEFYLVNNVGAMQETPGQNGFAHLTEHMCFNGTKNFHKKDIINYLQSIGMKFGPEINAYTVYDQTIYTLNKVPIEDKAHIDTSLMILFDWATNVSMDTEEINAERGVVREELRTRRSSNMRLRDKTNKVLFQDSKYAVHNIIGTVDVIDNSPCDTLRAYYNEWYRSDLQAIVVVGDFDIDAMEVKVKDMFAKLPVHKNARERQYFQIPNHKETRVIIAKDPEAPMVMTWIYVKHDVDSKRDVSYYREEYMQNLYATMANARLGEESMKPDPAFAQAGIFYTNLIRTKDAHISIAISSKDKIMVGTKAIMVEAERIKRYGFLQSELDRAKKELSAAIEKGYNERNKRTSDSYAEVLKDNYLTQEPIPSDEWDYEFGKQVLETVTLDEINELISKWIVNENRVVAITGPDKEDIIYPTEAEVLALFEEVEAMDIAQYVDADANKPLVAVVPTAGTIVKEEIDSKNKITRWTLSNGVNVVIMPTTFKDDEILMTAQSLGGYSKYGQKDDISSKIAAEVINQSGVGEFDFIELQKKLAGISASSTPYIGQLTEGFNGSSTIKDFETMLQLTYLYFTAPRTDKDAFASYKQREITVLENKSLDPQAGFIDSIRVNLASHSPRARMMTPEMFDEAKLSRIKYIFQDRFGDPSGFTFYFVGNINTDSMKTAILTYLGGLPKANRTETWNDLAIRMPKSKTKVKFERKMETAKASVFVGFTGDMKKYTIEDRLMLLAVKEYLSLRYTETLREEIGGTYGASLWTNMKHYPATEYQLGIYFDCDPEKMDTMVQVVYNVVTELQTEGADDTKVDNILKNKLKEHTESIKKNRYWLNIIKSDDFDNEDYKNFDYNKFWEGLTSKKIQKAAKKFLDANSVIEIIQTSK